MALEEGGEYNVLHNAGINVWTGRTGCMGIREASEYFFFFWGGGGGGGSNFRPLGLENGSNLIKCPEGTKEVFKLFIIILFIICIAPFLCPYQPHPPPPFLTLIYLHKERIYIPKLVSLYNMPL